MYTDIKITINEAIVFSLLEKFGNTYEVSKHLKLGTAAINASVNNLEKKLGKKLFNRNRRTGSFSLTDEGSKISHYVNTLVQTANDISHSPTIDNQHVIISSTHTVLEYIISPYLSQLLDSFPDVNVGFQQRDSLKFPDKKWNEIIITSFVDDIANYLYVPYHAFDQKLWASKEYILKYGSPETVEELIKHRLLMRRDVDEPKALFGSAYIKSKLVDTEGIKIIDVYGTRIIDVLCEKGWGIMSGAEEPLKLGNIKVQNVFPEFKGEQILMFVGLSKEFAQTRTAKKTLNWMFESRNKALWSIGKNPIYPYTPFKVE